MGERGGGSGRLVMQMVMQMVMQWCSVAVDSRIPGAQRMTEIPVLRVKTFECCFMMMPSFHIRIRYDRNIFSCSNLN